MRGSELQEKAESEYQKNHLTLLAEKDQEAASSEDSRKRV